MWAILLTIKKTPSISLSVT